MKFKYILFALLLSIAIPKQAQTTPTMYATVNEKKMRQWVDAVFNDMSEDERIGQLFMISADPSNETSNLKHLLRFVDEHKIGGILFMRGNPESQVKVVNRLQSAASVPLLIAIDGEWGLSMRLSQTTRFPKNMMLGAITDLDLIEQYGAEVGRQCREIGIHVNFAPVLDVNSNAANPVIGIRSFGEDPDDVARKSIAYAKGLEKAGVISVAKHFPGHGDTHKDSHFSLPTINHDLKRLQQVEMYPFERYIHSGLSGIMIGHLNIPALGTNGRPGTFSYKVVTELLRDQMGFQGLCFTDGLAMQGAIDGVGRSESIAVLALQAGNDILVGPINPEKEIEAVKKAVRKHELNMDDIDERCRRVLCYKYIVGLHRDLSNRISLDSINERLNTPHAAWLNARLNAEAITVVKNDNNILPLKRLDERRIAAVAAGGKLDNEFHKMLQRYADVDCYYIANSADASERKNICDRLRQGNYNTVIYSVHSEKATESREIQALVRENVGKHTREYIGVFFTLPYKCANFDVLTSDAQALVVAYEPTTQAESYAAQVIFGGIAAKGTLPVGISNIFPVGTGNITEKTRLGYHEPEEVNIDANKLQEIDHIVNEGLNAEAYPGCQVIVAKDEMIIYNKSFGYYDYTKKQEVTENTVYDLASVSKATGTLLAVMKSYDEGNFRITNRISDFITELKDTDKEDIIIRDMLYHQSGLPPVIRFYEQAIEPDSYTGSLYSRRQDTKHTVRYDAQTYVSTDFKFNPQLVSTKQQAHFGLEAGNNFYLRDEFATDSIIAGIQRARLGTDDKYVYSCVNFILLKIMVERQTGMKMDRLLDEHFFSRLGALSTTYNPLRKMDVSRIAPTENDKFLRRQTLRGHVHDEAAAFQGGVSGNAGLFSSANDLAKLMQLYLNNGIYGQEAYLTERTCNLFTGSKSPTSRRGLGFDKPDAKSPSKSPCGLLAPPSVFGHTGYTGTCFWVDPENDLFVIFLSNRTFPTRVNGKLSSLAIRSRIQDTIYKAMYH